MNRTAIRHAVQLGAMTVVCVLMPGCAADRGPSPTEQAQAQYQRGQYAQAQATAARAATTAGGAQRDMAHYMAGMSAYRLDNMAMAQRYLHVAAQSSDPSLAADARSTLGLIYSRQARFAEAADALLQSATLQKGEDRAQAFFYAGIAQQKLGRWPQARTSLLLARSTTRDRGLAHRVDQQLAVTGYTIQVGAFTERANASRAATSYAARARPLGLGNARVTPSTDARGRAVNLVQVGRYATFNAANAARIKLGDRSAVIVPLQR